MASLSERLRVMTAKATRYVALVMSVLLMASIAIPGAVAGASVSNDDLTLEVVQQTDTGNATVTVTLNDTPEENASVNVSSTEEYAGTGTYTTDADGTVELPEPNQTVSVNISAEANDTTVADDFELVPRSESFEVQISQDEGGAITGNVTLYDEPVENATVNVSTVDENETYEGSGERLTDENGTFGLPAPDTAVEIDVLATYDGLSDSTTIQLEGADLTVNLTQHDDFTSTVNVTRGDTPIENASVTVTSDVEYSGNGTYQTDENGQVPLPVPDEPVNVTVNATEGDDADEKTFKLDAPELAISVNQTEDDVVIEVLFGGEPADGANVTVEGEDYDHEDTKTADENGTVTFPAPLNDTDVNITAEYQDHSKTIQATFEARNDSNPNNDFAQALVAFIHSLNIEEMEGPPGQVISEFVHENNPSSADDNAGPPEHAGPPDHAGPKNETVNATEENATNEQGPPPWAGPPENKSNENKNKTKENGPPGQD